MNHVEIGQLYEPGKTSWQEEMIYSFDVCGHSLLLVLPELDETKLEIIRSGEAEFAFYEDGPAIFFLFRFGKVISWTDAVYSWHLVQRELRGVPDESTVGGAALKVLIVDAGTGILQAVREIKMDAEFTRLLHAAIIKQADGSFNGQSYAKYINGVWNQYTAEDMLEMANARFKA